MGFVENEGASGKAVKAVRSAIRLLLLVVFLGYMVIWCVMPTNTFYFHWFPAIETRTNSTYFGEQGAETLVYTFPILFIATMCCLYLHPGKKYADDVSSRGVFDSCFAWWKRPVLVKGALGIVSWIELSFFAMFIVLLLWSLSSLLHVTFAQSGKEAAEAGFHVWEVKLERVGLTLGIVGNICLAFLFFPVTRGSSVLQFLGLTSEASIKYHIWLGHGAMTLFTAHGLLYIIFWAKTHQLSQMLKWDKFLVSNVAGEIALLAGLVMWVTSLTRIRRKIFELFLYTHYLYILFVVFYVFHLGFSEACITLPGFYLFLIDRYLRLLQSQQKIFLVSARILPCETVELNFFKSPGLSYAPRSTLFINVPIISKLQWHPFTISSSSNMDPERLSIIVKSVGNWSHKLYHMLSSLSSMNHLEVSIEGPYGPTSTNFMRHDVLVMVSGGSGISPFISLIREILYTANTTSSKTPRVLLICAFKKSVDLTMLQLLLPVSGTTLDVSLLRLQIEAYITREKGCRTDDQKVLRTIWFKPHASDAPVYAVLGPNNWLWLGMIISASFIIFLLLIGILTRYYIYPIDHNTEKIYSLPGRSALNMLFICVSMGVIASAAFFWNKKQNAEEMRQIQNMNMPTPMPSPGPQVFNVDQELESLPHKSLLQATKVHLGGRPNLKKILLECEGESVGVVASGPREMREEVAAICSSGLAGNLHFESISFNW